MKHEGKWLLMVASSLNPDLLRTPRRLGLKVALVAARAPASRELIDAHIAADEMDAGAVLHAVRAYRASGGRIDAVACFHEGSLPAAAAAAAELALPGNPPEVVLAMRDKHRTATALRRAGIAAPRTYLVGSASEAVAAAQELGFPAIVKPQSSAASQGVTRVRNDAEA